MQNETIQRELSKLLREQQDAINNHSDPLSEAKTICHLCGKPHLHGPFDREKQLRINREHRWQRIKHALEYLPVPAIFFGLMTLGAIFGPHSQPLTAEEQREELRIKQRVAQIDAAMEALQNERDEIDPPDPGEPYPNL
jgi:hypothetical protein